MLQRPDRYLARRLNLNLHTVIQVGNLAKKNSFKTLCSLVSRGLKSMRNVNLIEALFMRMWDKSSFKAKIIACANFLNYLFITSAEIFIC